ncbi:hypothetical protein AGLY_008757 [Aphis glycines]|uniref:Uncharacterized protein n=1 Tax=Aphis glycines TaxID=307491 RepID=A0A6G0TLQ8_APHGL|nr:hypothetical protein AGLY_008757 [Aphis glycines]
MECKSTNRVCCSTIPYNGLKIKILTSSTSSVVVIITRVIHCEDNVNVNIFERLEISFSHYIQGFLFKITNYEIIFNHRSDEAAMDNYLLEISNNVLIDTKFFIQRKDRTEIIPQAKSKTAWKETSTHAEKNKSIDETNEISFPLMPTIQSLNLTTISYKAIQPYRLAIDQKF